MRKRSKYKPKPIRADTLTYVIQGLRLVNDTGSVALDLKIKNHSCLEALRTGQASRQDMDAIISALNVSEALCRLGTGHEYIEEVKQGQNSLLELSRRGIDRDDRFIAKAQELTDINYAYEVHDAQLDVCTIGQLEKALDLVEREIRARRATVIEEKVS